MELTYKAQFTLAYNHSSSLRMRCEACMMSVKWLHRIGPLYVSPNDAIRGLHDELQVA